MADEEYQELGAEEVEHAIDDLAGIDNVRMNGRMNGSRVLDRVERDAYVNLYLLFPFIYAG